MGWMPVSESVPQFDQTVIPGEPASLPPTRYGVGRDPWLDRLTTLSEAEGESRKIAGTRIILDPGSHPAPRDLAGITNCHTASSVGTKREGRQGHFQDAHGTLKRPPSTPWTALGFALILLMLSGCAYSQKGVYDPIHTLYLSHGEEDSLIHRFVPVFLTYNYREPHNRIGRPSARFDARGNEEIYVDHDKPAIYYMTRKFATERGTYTNLIYRIHFSEIPFSLIPFHLSAGKNVGLMVVITLDASQRPLLVTTVGTCGCYAAIVPTSYLPSDALPLDWKHEPLEVYGEELPSLLDYEEIKHPKLLIYLRSDVHRVMHLETLEEEKLRNPERFTLIQAPLIPMASLEQIPIDGEKTSFYHDRGPLKGHVKGSVKAWETLFLGLISLDFFVGTDKVYGDREITKNPFYTSLKPWNRNGSDMWDFAHFLEFWGWKL